MLGEGRKGTLSLELSSMLSLELSIHNMKTTGHRCISYVSCCLIKEWKKGGSAMNLFLP